MEALRRSFAKEGFEGFLICDEVNLLYFTGFPGAASLFVPRNDEGIIYVYGVNYEQAKTEGEGFKIELLKRREDYTERIVAQLKSSKIKKLAIDALSLEGYRKLQGSLKEETKIEMREKIVWELRKSKDEKELKFMREAAQLTCRGMGVAYKVIKPGIREYEVAAEIEYAMRKDGSGGTAFETIVASGVRSAFPHGGCTDRRIRRGELVVIDIGATYNYYCSDMTRTVVAGKPSAKQARIYEIVKQAQEEAFQSVKSKAEAREVDGVARKVIGEAGYEEYFVHGLGHGVGLQVHEPPSLNQESREQLDVRNTVTIEPGVYFIGFGGIRIEDTVLVHKGKGERLTEGYYTPTIMR